MTRFTRKALIVIAGSVFAAVCGHAELPVEHLETKVLAASHPHWVWVNDIAFNNMADGKAYLVDGDAGKLLGMVSTGFGHGGVVLPRAPGRIFSPEVYLSRGTRGQRTDVVTIYSSTELAPVSEISIPSKRSSSMPMLNASILTDDDRFLLVYNFTPAQSVTVVDAQAQKFVGEIETAGCALVYPTSARSFFSICADGSLLSVSLNDDGQATGTTRIAPLFDPVNDPVTEKAVRIDNTWLFASFAGEIYTVESHANSIALGARWWLTTPEERAQGWRSGGLQHLAIHRASRRLYAIMHQGGPGTHKDPGKEIWVYDLSSRRRIQRIELENLAGSIQVSQDSEPLLFASFIGSSTLDVYDAGSGKHLRAVHELGSTPTTLVTAQN